MVNGMSLDLNGGEAPNTNEVNNETLINSDNNKKRASKTNDVSNGSNNIDANVLSQAIAEAFLMIQSQQNENSIKLQKQKEEAQAMRTMNNAGLAVRNFQKRMLQEIKDGKYQELEYWPALADKYGDTLNVSISGYVVRFQRGLKTKVPHSLLSQVTEVLNGGVQHKLLTKKFSVIDSDTKTNDSDTENLMLNMIQGSLPSKSK